VINAFEFHDRFGHNLQIAETIKVERVVLNALVVDAALPPHICAFGDLSAVAFRHGESSIGTATDAKQGPRFPVDPPRAQ
jgi:hypothetical protein